MPRVPTYDGPQVQQQALRPVQQGPIDVSSGVQALGRAAGQVAGILDERAQRDAQTEAWQAQAAINQDFVTWQAQARKQRQGNNAKGFADEVTAWWDKAKEERFSQLSPMAQQLAARGLSQARLASLESATGYENQQLEIGARSALRGTLEGLRQQALDAPDTAGVVAAGVAELQRFGSARGVDVAPEITEFTNGVHLTRIESLAERSPIEAKKYLDRVRGELAPNVVPRIERVVEGEVLNHKAKGMAASWAALPLAEQMAKASEIAEPELRDKTLLHVKQNHAMVEAARRENQQAAADEAWSRYVDRGQRVPEALRMKMGETNLRELIAFERARADRIAKGEHIRTDWKAYIDLRERLFAGENVDLRPMTEKIAPAQMEQLLDIKTRTRDPKKLPEAVTMEQQVTATIGELKLKDDERGRFQSAIYDEFAAHQRRTGKEPTYAERQEIIDRMTTEVVTKPGWLWDTKDKPYNVPREQRAKLLAPPAGAAPTRVRTIDEARALPKGTRFIDPDGVERIR